ncbi:MAG: CARDB domain-containing protein [Nanoarchaeota archaeon]|nr:CARDB domain-containing protein [Nanoarchaeota archaeon]
MIKNKKANAGINILVFILFILVLILTIYSFYIIYSYIPGEPESLDVEINKDIVENISLSDVKQFYPNMKFNHNNISYFIYADCDLAKSSRVIKAFNILSEEIGYINFYDSIKNADIEVICSENDKQKLNSEKEFFIAGEGGAREIVKTGKNNVIINGTILLYKYSQNYKQCNAPNVEIHELIHVFGFDHSENKNSLMNPYLISCNQKIDESIVLELKRLYSESNFPDLYFEEVKAIKRGRYLDFNVTIKNSGTIDSMNTSLGVYEDGKLIESEPLGIIKFGGGVFYNVESLRISKSNPNKIVFKIDPNNTVKENDKTNNVAEIKFKQT